MQSRPLLSSQQVLDCSVSALAPSFPTAQLRLSHSCCRTINLQQRTGRDKTREDEREGKHESEVDWRKGLDEMRNEHADGPITAFLGSMASMTRAPTFMTYAQPGRPLPCTSPLHGWIQGSMDVMIDDSPECKKLLPETASAFIRHLSPRSSSSSQSTSLQHQLSQQATKSLFKASLQRAHEMKRRDEGLTLAHLTAVSAPRAWTWKTVLPTSSALELTDMQYRIAARLNIGGLLLMAGAAALPATCPLCALPGSIRNGPWHFLSCNKLSKGEVNVRHDDVGRALYRCSLIMGIRAQLEPKNLDPSSSLRPDLLLSLPGRSILTDVAICHPLAPEAVRSGHGRCTLGAAKHSETKKRRKYAQVSLQRHLEQLPFVMETCGGVGPSGDRLIKAMAEASEEHLAMWSRVDVIRELLGSVAMAVQRGGAMTYLEGYDRAIHVRQALKQQRSQHDGEDDVVSESGEEGEEKAAAAA